MRETLTSRSYGEGLETGRRPIQVPRQSLTRHLDVDATNVAVVVQIGRTRWKIENEQFNVHKNHGYELTHNYGHGQQTLSMVFYLLNLLAYVTHVVLALGDRLYQRCCAQESRRELWNALRTLVNLVLVESWTHWLTHYWDDAEASP